MKKILLVVGGIASVVVVTIVVGRAFDLPTTPIMGVLVGVGFLVAAGVARFGSSKSGATYEAPGFALLGLGILATDATERISGLSEIVDIFISVIGAVLIIGGVIVLARGVKKKAGRTVVDTHNISRFIICFQSCVT